MNKTTIFMTGASGNMGSETVKLLLQSDRYKVKAFVLPDRLGRKRIAEIQASPCRGELEVIWGDLTRRSEVIAAAAGADIILHLGAVIPPASDYHPALARKVNYEGTLHVIEAARSRADWNSVRLVFIGTIAESGSRLPPVHWGRIGDPIMVSWGDAYSESKVMAERAVVESGLPGWVSLRQTAMLHPNLFHALDPIIFHQPLNTHMEWVTVGDTARALKSICDKHVEGSLPAGFWQQVYNVGGGENFRKTNEEFMRDGFGLMGIRDFRRTVKPNWFATGNFHGLWFRDSDRLEEILHFREDTYEEFFRQAEASLSPARRVLKFLASITPPFLIRNFVMRPLANAPHGTLYAVRKHLSERYRQFWGPDASWKDLSPVWTGFRLERDPPSLEIRRGFDERKPAELLTLEDMRATAAFRGGRCLSPGMEQGNLGRALEWECAAGHRFSATPRLVLQTGHWCPICDIAAEKYRELGRRNSFLGQITGPIQAAARTAATPEKSGRRRTAPAG